MPDNRRVAQTVNPPRGMRDFLPADKARREAILGVIRGTYRAHGFAEIETPVAEESSRLHAGLGGDNEKLAFAIMRRGLGADDLRAAATPLDLADLGLRFDLTVPLARFYATHRAELPVPFRAIQIAPVWRAERPQAGRYRQFVQCDIDIIGDAGGLAEVEILTASAAALRALGITGFTFRVNDRRLLTAMLAAFGFAPADTDGVLITVDKLDKVGVGGVVAELRERGAAAAAVAALEAFLSRPAAEPGVFGAAQIRAALPAGLDDPAIAELAAIGAAVAAASPDRDPLTDPIVRYDPWLVRGMGYYTGPIFEAVHPSLGYSFGGGGRYDGMIGRFLGQDVPAVGFSLGFERLADLVRLPETDGEPGIAIVYDPATPPATVIAARDRFVAAGRPLRLIRRPKQLARTLDALAADGLTEFILLTPDADPATVTPRPLDAR
jgi:histidyl-tRNA synthetase